MIRAFDIASVENDAFIAESDAILLEQEDQYPGLAELLEDILTPQISFEVDPAEPQRGVAMYIETLKLDLPIELQTLRDNNNRFVLGTSPPTQWIETSVQPVLHQLRLTLEVDDE